MKDLSFLQTTVRLSLRNPNASSSDHSEFGYGVAKLCEGVRDFGSLNRAAKNMGMAYSKAWRIVKGTEDSFGIALLNRDGAHGSTLTEEGNLLLDAYLELCKCQSEQAQAAFLAAVGDAAGKRGL